MTFEEQTRQDFEREGAASVRLRVQSRLVGTAQIAFALQWLREKDAEAEAQAARERVAASRAERLANVRDTVAAIAAIIAAVTAILGAFMEYLVWRR